MQNINGSLITELRPLPTMSLALFSQQFTEHFSSPQKVLITTHHKPDGDAMGSTLGLKIWLRSMGHDVIIVSPTDWAAFLDFLPLSNEIINFEKNKVKCEEMMYDVDHVFCLDFNHPSRVNDLQESLIHTKATKWMIDHHQNPAPFCQVVYSNPEACSTSEMVYRLIQTVNPTMLNKDIATCLYTGIVSDTGRFQYYNTTPEVLQIAAHLMEVGVDHGIVNDALFGNFPKHRLDFFAFCISHRLEVFPEYKTAIMAVNYKDLQDYGITTGETEYLVSYPMMLADVNFVILLIDRKIIRKISFRSKGNFKCNEFAQQHFNGGGHINASGGNSHQNIEKTKEHIISLLPKYKSEIINSK